MTAMVVYLLKRQPGDREFDQMQGCVVIAPTPQDARILAQAEESSEYRTDWLTPSKTTCEPIGESTANLPQIVLTDINWG